jgi:membrane protein
MGRSNPGPPSTKAGGPAEPPAGPASTKWWTRAIAGGRAHIARLMARRARSFPIRCLRRFAAINGRDRSFVLAGQAFTTVIPLLIVVSATAGKNGTSLVADRFNSRFRLTGSPAEALRTLFQRPPGATGTITLVGVLVLLFSLVSLTRSMQRIFEDAWGLRAVGVRGTLHGLTGMGLLLASVLILSLLVTAMRPLPAGTVLAAIVRTVAAVGMWLLLLELLLSRRIPLRRLIPGAVVAGVGQTAFSVYSAVWMPHVIAQNADQYGVIGVTFALLSWLVVLGLAVVVLAATSAELGGADSLDDPQPDPA